MQNRHWASLQAPINTAAFQSHLQGQPGDSPPFWLPASHSRTLPRSPFSIVPSRSCCDPTVWVCTAMHQYQLMWRRGDSLHIMQPQPMLQLYLQCCPITKQRLLSILASCCLSAVCIHILDRSSVKKSADSTNSPVCKVPLRPAERNCTVQYCTY